MNLYSDVYKMLIMSRLYISPSGSKAIIATHGDQHFDSTIPPLYPDQTSSKPRSLTSQKIMRNAFSYFTGVVLI